MASLAATFTFPTAVLCGPGTLAELPPRLKQMGVRRPLVVTDPGLLETRCFERLRESLGSHRLGQSWELYHGVRSNPSEQDVVEAARVFRESECDAVIGFGGGSALDVAKALRLLVKHPTLRLDHYQSEGDWTGLPRCVCIPTTAGTGTEVGRSVVITLAQTQSRATIFLPRLLAKLVILDPNLTVELPPILTAATGLDALTHCVESFTSPVFQPFCDGIALEGIHMIGRMLPRAYQDGQDLEARGLMQVASAMGGVAFQKDLGAVHSLAHPLSALCGMHHGVANALCLAPVMEWNSQRKPGLYRRVGWACGLDVLKVKDAEADQMTIRFLKDFIAKLGLSGSLKDHGIKSGQIEALATQAFADSCHLTNPVKVSRDDFKSLYQGLL